MKLTMTFGSKRLLTISVLMLVLSFQVAAAATDDRTNKTYTSITEISEKIFNRKPKPHGSSLAISPDEVLYRLRQKQKITLVDVRNTEDFERLHIHGSLNIPLYALKTKDFLKPFPMVLINEGFRYSLLAAECRELEDRGFKVFILDGGLTAWAVKGKPLTGDLFALEEMQFVSPRDFLQEKDCENTLVIDISLVHSEFSRQLMPYARHLPAYLKPDKWIRKLDRHIAEHKNQPFLSVLVINESGDGYESINKLWTGQDLNVFFLQSGLVGYKKYLEDLNLSWLPRESRIKTNRNCKVCIEETPSLYEQNGNS